MINPRELNRAVPDLEDEDPALVATEVDTDPNLDLDLDTEVFMFGGERLTEARAGAIAEETLAEIRLRNLIPGRKSLSGGSKHSPRVQFRVPDEIREKAEKRATEEGVTLSVLAREALEQYLAS